MAQAAIAREDYSHPEKIYKDLIRRAPGVKISDEDAQKQKKLIGAGDDNNPDKELCWSCGWSVKNEWYSCYGSRIRIFHTRGNIGIWEIGSQWMIRDQPNDASLGNDYITQEFLRNQSNLNIPLLKEMRKLSKPGDKIDLTLMSRAQGVGLDTIWDTLSSKQKSDYSNQLASAIKQWRQFTSPIAKKVDGGVPDDCLIAHCVRLVAPTCKKMGRTTEEWFDNIEKELRLGLCLLHKTNDPLIIEEKFQQLKKGFPTSEPYVLTHGDLNLTNIIVKDEKIEAIIDWELSGYFPWWAERWMSLRAGRDDMDELFDPLWADIDSEMNEEIFPEVCEGVWADDRHGYALVSANVNLIPGNSDGTNLDIKTSIF
ncbi:hypothetical protein LSUE1_G008583 [Lachnellula suecica]|uniref:Aminoglycoside phosphotransferase domain-containing protein n=1 Tax=Lachnellula suecica TaxID=602035 RepID=A0A8T9C7Z5_9HELO|nr:hypothetical protein LSUE1_G008583 [Lachnellula suecica]